MDTKSLADAVRNRLAILIDVTPSSIHDDTRFSDLGADSLMLLELVALVEQQIGFELPEEDLDKLQTIDDVQRYVVGYAHATDAPPAPTG